MGHLAVRIRECNSPALQAISFVLRVPLPISPSWLFHFLLSCVLSISVQPLPSFLGSDGHSFISQSLPSVLLPVAPANAARVLGKVPKRAKFSKGKWKRLGFPGQTCP